MRKIDIAEVDRLKNEIYRKESATVNTLTAYDKIKALVDASSFVEMFALLSKENIPAGIITGYGTVAGRPVYVFAQDASVELGTMNAQHAQKLVKLLKLALKTATPVVGFFESEGLKLSDGNVALEAYAEVYSALVELNGICPSIAIISGNCIGLASIFSQLCDISIGIKDKAFVAMNGPQVLQANFKNTSPINEVLACSDVAKQGGYSLIADTFEHAILLTQKALDFLPDCNADKPHFKESNELNKRVSFNAESSTDDIVNDLADVDGYLELWAAYAPAVRTYIARMGGYAVALLITNAIECDVLDEKALLKASKLVSLADNYNLSIITLVNAKGLKLVSPDEQLGLIKAQTQWIHNYYSASVPKISLIYGVAFGHIYSAFASKTANDMVFAWPSALVSPLEPSVAIQLLETEKIHQSSLELAEMKETLEDEYIEHKASSLALAKLGLCDDVIDPQYSRMHIISALEMLETKSVARFSKKHGHVFL